MAVNLSACDKACTACIKSYIGKHTLKKGDTFSIQCGGIPIDFIPKEAAKYLEDEYDAALTIFDPVAWAAKYLDWHCIDPVGEHWKRKTLEASLPTGVPGYTEAAALAGKSPFHRPYQAIQLRCSAKYKVLRSGRQIGKTTVLGIAGLHMMWTNENFKIVLITPYQSQIDVIFNNLTQLIQSNPILQNAVKRNVKAPNYQIALHNGSRITGFTAATHSGGNANAARGQSANMLIFDEADLLASKDLDSSLAIITNFPEATVWMSSTPTGKRERFYQICHDKTWKEYHFPSHVNPNWTEHLDNLFKNQLTQEGYRHEILADFGEQEQGVYHLKYVEAAQDDYPYGYFKYDEKWVYSIGVDWNDYRIGTTLAVVGYNPATGYFYLVDRDIVSRGEHTQLSACQRVAELNKKWLPEFIYVDQGFGYVQIEVLRKFGVDAIRTEGPNSATAKLREIVKPYNFGGHIEVRDLFTKQLVKKPAKPFLVENSVRRFEQFAFKYPKADKAYTQALLSYIVKRTTVTGAPVYESQDESVGDHFLDAVNLALVGFTLEKSDFGKVHYESQIAFSTEFRQPQKIADFSDSKAHLFTHVAEEHKPQSGRANPTGNQPKSTLPEPKLPVANTSLGVSNMRIWSWPGFLRDEPPPAAKKRTIFRPQAKTRPSRAKF